MYICVYIYGTPQGKDLFHPRRRRRRLLRHEASALARYRCTAAFVRCAHARRVARLLARQRAADGMRACGRRGETNGSMEQTGTLTAITAAARRRLTRRHADRQPRAALPAEASGSWLSGNGLSGNGPKWEQPQAALPAEARAAAGGAMHARRCAAQKEGDLLLLRRVLRNTGRQRGNARSTRACVCECGAFRAVPLQSA